MRFIVILSITIFITSCDLDQVENSYANYNEAIKEEFLLKGWIPENLIKTSMTDIYVRNNLDLNTCIFSFQLSQSDFDSIKVNLMQIDTEMQMPRRIKIPKWWIKNVSGLNNKYFIVENNDSVFISIDNQKSTIYGWRK